MFYSGSSSSSSDYDDDSTSYASCTCDVTTRDIHSPRPGYLAYYLDTSSSSNTSRSSSEAISRSEMRKLNEQSNCGLVMNKTGNFYQGYRVQKCLRVKHVDKAAECSTYAQVSLHPSSETNVMCTTGAVVSVGNPVFNEKFSFELMSGDENKRVLLSVFQRVESETSPHLIGCMSFGVKRLYDQSVSGWYYLLAENIGRLKHRRVCHPSIGSGAAAVKNRNHSRRIRRRVRNSDSTTDHVITICGAHDNPKGLVPGGRGFSVSGEGPTFVARVQTGSAADQAGLLTGDRIIRIDGIDVSGHTSEALARIIRSSNGDAQLRLDVERTVSKLHQKPYHRHYIPTSPVRVDDFTKPSVVSPSRRQSLNTAGTMNSPRKQVHDPLPPNPKASKSVRRKHLRIRTPKRTSPQDVVSPADPGAVVIDELDKSPRRLPSDDSRTRSAQPPVTPTRTRSAVLTSDAERSRLIPDSDDDDAAVSGPSVFVPRRYCISRLRCTLSADKHRINDVSNVHSSHDVSETAMNDAGQRSSDDVTRGDSFTAASRMLQDVKWTGKTVERVVTHVEKTLRVRNPSNDVGNYVLAAGHRGRPGNKDAEPHYVDMASYRSRLLQSESESLREPSAGLYESWIKRQEDGVAMLKAASDRQRTSSKDNEMTDYVRINSAMSPDKQLLKFVAGSHYADSLGSDYVQINNATSPSPSQHHQPVVPRSHSTDTTSGSRFIYGSDFDPFGLVPLAGTSPSMTYSAFYAHGTSTSAAGYDVIIGNDEQRDGNNKKASTSCVDTVAVQKNVDITRASKIKNTTRSAIKEFLAENLGKFL